MAKTTLIALTLALLLGLAAAGLAGAGSSTQYAVNWQVLAGGGAPVASNGGGVSLNGTLGQPIIGPAAGSEVDLGAGYWYGAGSGSTGIKVYLPVILAAP